MIAFLCVLMHDVHVCFVYVHVRLCMYVHMIVLRAMMHDVHVCCVCMFMYVYACMCI
jgi:hypothetical protein